MHKLLLPLIAWIFFTGFTVFVVIDRGLAELIPIHMVGGWPTQVFVDLILAALCFLVVAAPDARRRAIKFWPYILATLLLGSIGILAYMIRRELGAAGRLGDPR